MLGDSVDRLTDDALIVDPWVEKAAAPKPGRQWGVVAVIACCIAQTGAAAAAGQFGFQYYADTHRPVKQVVPDTTPLKDEVEHKNIDDRGSVAHAPVAPDLAPSGSVPQETERTEVGAVKVVELGYKVASLKQALSAEQATAKASGKDVLVMVADSSCVPCKGVMKSLADNAMQQALSSVVLVRVDLEVFDKELQALHLEQFEKGRPVMPGFFLLAPDGTPRDAINGGEWDDDIAANIAPVLGPFVRGDYDKKKRKSDWKKPLPQGVFL